VDWSDPQTRASLLSRSRSWTDPDEGPGTRALEKYYRQFSGTGDLHRHSHVLIQTFLASHNFLYTDKSSMAASLEVRVPFMDVELMRLCARIPERLKLNGNRTKYVLKRAMEPSLPREVLSRSKTGFGAPLRKWMSDDLLPLTEELLGQRRLEKRGLFEADTVRRLVRDNLENRADHAYLLYALLSLEIWQQTFIDRPGEEVAL
jgi:asparagine synthase (glutamine-hydrolysing)